jgi:hypothetical protein
LLFCGPAIVARVARANVTIENMSRNSYKRLFEFFLQESSEVSGQMLAKVPQFELQAERFLQGLMSKAERGAFFEAIHLNADVIKLLAEKIQTNARENPAKKKTPCRVPRKKKI